MLRGCRGCTSSQGQLGGLLRGPGLGQRIVTYSLSSWSLNIKPVLQQMAPCWRSKISQECSMIFSVSLASEVNEANLSSTGRSAATTDNAVLDA